MGTTAVAWVGGAAVGNCTTPTILGTYFDIGFAPAGAVRYQYDAFATATATAVPAVGACAAVGATAAPGLGFTVTASANLDGTGTNGIYRVAEVTQVTDCNPGQF